MSIDKSKSATDNVFINEAYDLLDELEVRIIRLEKEPETRGLVNDIFVDLHTMKGSAAMLGFEQISAFIHEVESVFEVIRSKERTVNKDFVSFVLRAVDHIRAMFHHYDEFLYASELFGRDSEDAAELPDDEKQSIQMRTDEILYCMKEFIAGSPLCPLMQRESSALKKSEKPVAPQEADTEGGLLKILVMDDDFRTRNIYPRFLRSCCRCACDLAADGQEGTEAVVEALRQGKPYDLIFLDIEMPRLNGQQALKKIRQAEYESSAGKGGGAKIFMTTGLDDRENVLEAFREQVDGYIVKPITKEKLLQHMRQCGFNV